MDKNSGLPNYIKDLENDYFVRKCENNSIAYTDRSNKKVTLIKLALCI